MTDLYALVIAGGRGTRFWPYSRRHRPKQCVHLGEEASLLRQTIERLSPLVPAERLLVITGHDMAEAVRAELSDLPPENILVEPSGRNTAPCIGWGAVEIGRRGGGSAIMGVFPADHQIEDASALRDVVVAAAQAARATNALVTLGVTPTRPETGYGYLEVSVEVGEWGGHRFHAVERFTEKPSAETASRYLAGGVHLWNAGMFVFKVDAIRDAFRSYLPASAEALERIQHDPGRFEELWGRLDATSIDYGIMERSRHILTVPCDVGWSDVGSWPVAAESFPSVQGGRGIAEVVVGLDASNCVVHAPGKMVALLGVSNLVVVDTPDALLVVDQSRAQEVGAIVEELEQRGEGRFT